MNKKDAIAYAKRESHNLRIREISWSKNRIASVDGKGSHEIAILIWEYDMEADWELADGPQTLTRLKLFIDGQPRYGDYIG